MYFPAVTVQRNVNLGAINTRLVGRISCYVYAQPCTSFCSTSCAEQSSCFRILAPSGLRGFRGHARFPRELENVDRFLQELSFRLVSTFGNDLIMRHHLVAFAAPIHVLGSVPQAKRFQNVIQTTTLIGCQMACVLGGKEAKQVAGNLQIVTIWLRQRKLLTT